MASGNLSNGHKRILLVSDAWEPQVNGVVTTLKNVVKQLEIAGHAVRVITPADCVFQIPTPYPDVKMGFWLNHSPTEMIKQFDCVHIATPEGSVGKKYLRAMEKTNRKFTTGYHTKWPEFLNHMFGIPAQFTYKYMRRLHRNSSAVMVPTEMAKLELDKKGFTNVVTWTRGVDRQQFVFNDKPTLPLLVCVSRISKEKGLDDFCQLKTNMPKVVVGDGPYLSELKNKYSDVTFVGVKHGEQLAECYRQASCFVFPSRTDTFGVVMIEAMACGTPVAAYPVTGPLDVIEQGITGFMHNDLDVAIQKAMDIDRSTVYEGSLKWTWENCAKQFLDYLAHVQLR